MKHILAVDDNSANLQMVRGILQKLYQVTPVNNGERALQFLERKTPDLILLDYEMPVTSGPQVLEMIRSGGMNRWANLAKINVVNGLR